MKDALATGVAIKRRRHWSVRILAACAVGGGFYLFGRGVWRPFIRNIESAMSEAALDAARHCLTDA